MSGSLAEQSVWPVDRIKDQVSKIGSGVTPSGGAASYLDDGVPLLRSQNVHFDGLRLDDVVLMTEGGDLDKLGRGHVWSGEIPGCLHQNHIFAVRCFHHKLMPKFLAYVTAAGID